MIGKVASMFNSHPNPRARQRALILLLLSLFVSQSPQGALAALFQPSQARIVSSTPAPAKARRNLGVFFEKLRSGKAVTVAYLGGLLLAGQGASDAAKSSYRALVANWLRQQAPQTTFNEINAAVPGTGMLYGALRVRRDVIAYKPDLVFLEFALPEANDAPETEEAVKKALEGILRQLLIVPQPPEVVLLYPTNAQRAARVEWQEAIAAHYQIPSLDLQAAVWRQLDAGTLKPASLWKDGATPTDEAHKLYANLITAFLAEQSKLAPTPIAKNLPPPLVSDEMNYGEFKAIAELKHDAQWRNETSNDRLLPSLLLASEKPNAQLECYFEGSVIGLTYRAGPDGGIFECLIDGKPAPAPLNRIDTYAPTPRLQTRIIPGGLVASEHKLTIRVLSEKHPKSSGQQVRLGSLLVGGQRPEKL
jgi:hypothetical protein